MFHFLKNKETLLKEKLFQTLLLTAQDKTFSENKIKTVGILTTNNISLQYNLQNLVENVLRVRNSKIYSYRVFSKTNEDSYRHFSEKEITKKGMILNPGLTHFLQTPLDLLITFLDAPNLYVEYATAISKAHYKVGFAKVNSELFDLEIVSNSSKINEFLSELKKYLLILNKLD